MGQNRKRRIRAQKTKWAFVYERHDLYLPALQGNESDLALLPAYTLEQARTLNVPLLRDEKGHVVPTGDYIKVPVTADLSWIKPHIQHSANHRRDKERASTFRRSVYGAPLRILHNPKAYQSHFRGKEVINDILNPNKSVTFS